MQKREAKLLPFLLLLFGLFDDRYVTDVRMFHPFVVACMYFPYVYIYLRHAASAVRSSIPSFVQVCCFEDQVAPTVVDIHFEFADVDAHAYRHEDIIYTVVVERTECIRRIQHVLRDHFHIVIGGIGTAERVYYHLLYHIRSCIRVREGWVL